MAGGIATIAAAIGEDMRGRLPGQNKKQRDGLALLTATMLDVRSANLMDLAAALPRAAERLDIRYQWLSRLLARIIHYIHYTANAGGGGRGRKTRPVPHPATAREQFRLSSRFARGKAELGEKVRHVNLVFFIKNLCNSL